MHYSDANMEPLADVLVEMTGVPRERTAGFVLMMATYEEDGTPSGRLLTSTAELREARMLIYRGLAQVEKELERLSGLS